MEIYRINIEKAARKFLDKQPKFQCLRLYKAIYKLPDGDVRKLKGKDKFRLRVGNYRVLYMIDDRKRIITIENIDNRGDIYKKLV